MRFAHDIVPLKKSPEDLAESINRLCNDCKPHGMMLNPLKTKSMVLGIETSKRH